MISRKAITSFLLAPASLWLHIVGRLMGVSVVTVWGLEAEEINEIQTMVERKGG